MFMFSGGRCFSRARAVAVIVAGGAFALLLVSGCGSGGLGRMPVGGQVTVNGQQLEKSTISLIPTGSTKGPTAGSAIKNGSYEISREYGPVLGTYRVEIRAFQKTGKKIPGGGMTSQRSLVDETVQFIPAEYNSQSTLTVEIESGSNTRDFDVRIK